VLSVHFYISIYLISISAQKDAARPIATGLLFKNRYQTN